VILTGEVCPTATLSFTNPTCTDLKSNPGLVWLEACDQLVLLIILPNIALNFYVSIETTHL
jgi:hypothetical protein